MSFNRYRDTQTDEHIEIPPVSYSDIILFGAAARKGKGKRRCDEGGGRDFEASSDNLKVILVGAAAEQKENNDLDRMVLIIDVRSYDHSYVVVVELVV